MKHNLTYYFKLIRKYGWLIILLALISLLIGMVRIFLVTPLYRTQVTFVIGPVNSITDDRQVSKNLATLSKDSVPKTYVEIFDSEHIRASAIESLGFSVEDMAEYESNTILLPTSNVLRLTVSGANPEIVAALANEIGKNSIAYTSRIYKVFKVSFLDTASIAQTPYSPVLQRDATVSIILGLVIGVLVVVILEQFKIFGLDNNSFVPKKNHINIPAVSNGGSIR